MKWLRSCITPGYVTMLVAAFVLWYMAKLGDTYTTECEIAIVVDGEEYGVNCTIRGKGTNLIGYSWGAKRRSIEIPLAELSFDGMATDSDGKTYRQVSASSLQYALSSRMPDVDVVAVGAPPSIERVSNADSKR